MEVTQRAGRLSPKPLAILRAGFERLMDGCAGGELSAFIAFAIASRGCAMHEFSTATPSQPDRPEAGIPQTNSGST